MFSKKATQIDEIFTVDLTLCSMKLAILLDYKHALPSFATLSQSAKIGLLKWIFYVNKNDVKSFHLDRENLKFFEYFE